MGNHRAVLFKVTTSRKICGIVQKWNWTEIYWKYSFYAKNIRGKYKWKC